MATIPIYHNLSFYTDPEGNKARYESLLSKFKEEYKRGPSFLSRSPGRVNIIGEHIDYNYFSVLPMAMEVDVVAAVAVTDDGKMVLTNTDEEFQKEQFDLPSDGSVISINKDQHSWGNYFRCSLIVAHKFILEKYPNLVQGGSKPLKGMRLTFDGNVPTGGGLSSSAAFCVASIMAVLKANGINTVTKEDLTRISVVSEHYVGVNTGGMDQCASIYGEREKALLIQFRPKLIGIPFQIPSTKPEEMVFLVTNTLVQANKHKTAATNYNLRVVEMTVAAEILAKKYNLTLPKDSNLKTAGTLRSFMDTYYEQYLKQPPWDGNDIAVGLERTQEMLKITETFFSEEEKVGFTTEQMAKKLEMSVEHFTETFLTAMPVRYDLMKIYQRAIHVFSEFLRVLQTLKLFHEHKPSDNSENFLRAFGKLLNDSQRSADINNNSSSPELREVCAISTANGAYGARTTGAGWGGSAVHLTTVKRLSEVIRALKKQYYNKHFPNLSQEGLDAAIVVSKPAMGACLVELNGPVL
ncbi:galactokinase Gal1 [Schizosaccharomyces cryophilus OY26]|uniref:Galactokinase n=1 Tax=Schizosaccharomyces cryophilus (strain OY26 / ATCC MYA-4695 / CBS 11777 / NBRC 106824 / NRRL Y48691) TaxID=653667 RepID=S9XBC0_SCHCR|nr:galactokinase Gal1 [Schizosaccharomyces cryophilus OY26]EPY51056.1 galactokinase Gal1 [Schizosaccharomyces cryophilus OY26]